jgi:hypothetical protein
MRMLVLEDPAMTMATGLLPHDHGRRCRRRTRLLRKEQPAPLSLAQDAIAHPDDCLYDRRLTQLLRSRPIVNCHCLGERVGVLVPDALQELLGAQVSGRGSHEGLQESELFGRKFEWQSLAGDGAAQAIELYSSIPQGTRLGMGLAPGERPHPEDQLGEVERLYQMSSAPRRSRSSYRPRKPPR